MTPPVARTPRLALRPAGADDLERLHALCTLPDVRRYLFDDETWSREEVRERLVVESLRLWREEGAGLFVLARDAADEMIGWVALWYFREPREREVAYALDPAHRGCGYAAEAARAMMAWGAKVLGDTVFRASADAPNEASIRVLTRLGFTEVRRSQGRVHETVHFQRPLAGLAIDDIEILPPGR